MSTVKRIYVEKKAPYAGKAKELKAEIKGYLGIKSVEDVRIFIRYDVENVSDEVFEKACTTVFSEPPVDILYREEIEVPANAKTFSIEALPGQFDQRADSAEQCVRFPADLAGEVAADESDQHKDVTGRGSFGDDADPVAAGELFPEVRLR